MFLFSCQVVSDFFVTPGTIACQHRMVFVFLCLTFTSLSMTISRSIHVATNSIISFFSMATIPVCVCVCVCVCVLPLWLSC